MSEKRSADYNERRDEASRSPPINGDGNTTAVLKPNEARQATTKPQMWRVLAASLAGAVVALFVVWFFFFPTQGAMQTALPPAGTLLERTPGFEPQPTEPTVP